MRSTVLYFFHLVVTLVIILRLFPAGAVEQQGASTTNSNTAKVVRLDPHFDTLVLRDAMLEKVADGFTWVEGPVWHGNYLHGVFVWHRTASCAVPRMRSERRLSPKYS